MRSMFFKLDPGPAWDQTTAQAIYYGWYSNRSRGDRKRSCHTTDEIETDAAGGPDSDTPESELTKAARSSFTRLCVRARAIS